MGLIASGAPVRFDDLSIVTSGAPSVTSGTGDAAVTPAEPQPARVLPDNANVLYTSQFTGNLPDTGWTPYAGDWQVRDGALVQQQLDGYDLGITYQQPFEKARVSAKFKLEQGVGAGLLFNLPHADGKNGGHMVRYTDDGAGIFWGYFDDQGVFTGQGFAGTPSPGATAHVLEVLADASTYAVVLDGVMLAEGLQLYSPRGYIGLTTSQSTAAFQQVAVASWTAGAAPLQAAASVAPAASSNLLANTETLSGEWVKDGTTIRQQATDAVDYVSGIGILAEEYMLSTDIELPAGVGDAGGGVIFHMPQRDNRKGAYLARFGDGGKLLFWGQYNDAGEFAGQGSVETNLEAGKPHNLTLSVKQGSFDLAVDGNQVVAGVPLASKSGWIGLTSFRGPVVFSNLQLTLGGATK